MGGELVLSLCLPATVNGASLFSVRKVLHEYGVDLPRRLRRCTVATEAWNSSFSSNLEGNSDCRFHSSLDSQHPHHQNHQQQQQQQQHHHHHHYHLHQHQHHAFHCHPLSHPWEGSSDVDWHSRRLGSDFSMAAGSESFGMESPEHVHCFFHNSKCSSSINADPITGNYACAGGVVATGVDLPLSLRMLKRKQQDLGKSSLASGLSEVGNSLLNAFSSVVYMMKTLHSHTLLMRQHFCAVQEIEGLLRQVHQEMHISFLWLFQQVFSCTPELMVLIMVFLADFTAFSMASNIPLLPISMYSPPVSIASALSNNVKSSNEGLKAYFNMAVEASSSVIDKADGTHNDGGYFGNGGRRIYNINKGDYNDPDFYKISMNVNKAPYAADDNVPSALSSKVSSSGKDSTSQVGLPPNADLLSSTEFSMPSEFSDMAAALAFQELMTSEDQALSPATSNDVVQSAEAANDVESAGNSTHLFLDEETVRSFVAPFSARLEDDDYSCYDKTDLAYQVAIGRDSKNPMLLANYAQFLFLVRKDYDRAEELFRKAVLCDPFDCDAISRFASFLWLARHNLAGAEKAYKAALRADPTSSFHAANYAHFLWNSGL